MTTNTIQKPNSQPEIITNDIELKLDDILAQTWEQGMPNGVLNVF